MKKIGIITLNGYNNFGNRLQNYALEQFIIKTFEDYEVETIRYDARKKDFFSVLNRALKRSFFENLKMVNKSIFYKKDVELEKNKVERFKKFSENYLNETNRVYNSKNLPENFKDYYDFFIVGSDQVWNPKNVYCDSFYFLEFAKPNQRVAYAPSFAVENIDKEYRSMYELWLENFTFKSVREDKGAQIIEELTGEKVPVLVDPTLLLDKRDWIKISETHAKKPSSNYILTYFLGENRKKGKKRGEEIGKMYNLKVVNLFDMEDKDFYTTNPSEFIDLLENSSLMITDSFHGTVFSILFDVPFITFSRGDTNSRIDTLLQLFDLQSRKAINISDNDENLFFGEVKNKDQILDEEKRKAKFFLSKAILEGTTGDEKR